MSQTPELALVAGAGEGLGHALLRCFEAKGMRAVGLSRSGAGQASEFDIRACDLSDPQAVHRVLGAIIDEFGPPRIVVHNPASLVIAPFLETSLEEFEECWRSMAFSAAALAQCTVQPMVRAGGGTFIVSGATASARGGARFSAFASAKFALRGLTQSLAREFQSSGVHVVHTLLDGIIDTPRSRDLHTLDSSRMIAPDDLAEVYWQLAQQPQSAWTHELDLRPMCEQF